MKTKILQIIAYGIIISSVCYLISSALKACKSVANRVEIEHGKSSEVNQKMPEHRAKELDYLFNR